MRRIARLVAETLARVIQRADELAEFLAIYWAEGRQPLSGQVKKGLAAAFAKFDEYALAKYDRAGAGSICATCSFSRTRSRPMLRRPRCGSGWSQNELATPDTWEVALSAAGRADGASKQEVWERLLSERKLGALALLRNLRNMHEAGVREDLVLGELAAMKTERVLPFRFLAAARRAPQWEEALELAMFRCLASQAAEGRAARLAGHTVLLVDVSGSMNYQLSQRSEMNRTDAAYGLAILLREIAEKVTIFTFSNVAVRVPARRGLALRDALDQSQPHQATYLGAALVQVEADRDCAAYDRLVVITDEQANDTVRNPRGRGYMINVASNRNGVGYGGWTHIDGFSEAVVEYIAELERSPDVVQEL